MTKTVLLDENIPRPLKRLLKNCEVATVQEMGWSELKNGKLLDKANGKFDVLLTADKSIPYQQNMTRRKISMVVIRPKRLHIKFIVPMLDRVVSAIENVPTGGIIIVE